jgi:hypothetical protein
MDYVKNLSMGEYQWKSVDVFRSCCKQVVCTMLDAHKKLGYRHNDLHSKNVLLKRTSCRKITYECGQSVELFGLKTLIMDLEMSSFNQPDEKFFGDLDEFFSSLVFKVDIADGSTIDPIRRRILDWKEKKDGCDKALELIPMIDGIKLSI